MSAPAATVSRASATLITRLHAVRSTTSSRPCQHLLRQFSQSRYRLAATEKVESSSAARYQSYTLNPRAPPASQNETVTEATVSSPIPKVHETRPPPEQSQAAPAQDQQQQQQQPRTAAPPAVDGEAQKGKQAPPRRKLRPRKAAMKLTPTAVEQLRDLLNQPDPKLIKVGVRNRGCSGLAYHLEYVDKPGAFDEAVEQDGVKVLIDSKALFSIIGSEMDWVEDKLNQRFVFRNPNIKEECGCGESFMV